MPRFSRVFLQAFSIAAFSMSLAAFTPGFAADTDGANLPQTQEQALQSPAGKFVQALGDRVIKIIADKQMTTEQHNAQFSEILSDSFDLNIIGHFVCGQSWNTATPAQQVEYMNLFKALIIKTYGARIALATGQGFQVVGIRTEPDMDTIVLSQFTHLDGSQPTSINWRVRERDGKMGVVDVVFEGVSLSVTQRDDYAAVVQNSGGQIGGLLVAMSNQLKALTVASATK
jgi:phospholipid transport system substrate-binding protein